jgi:N-acetylmuramoyl-L-alanine amidase
MPAILVELGFLTNPDDRARLTDPEHRARVARAIVEGVREWMGA